MSKNQSEQTQGKVQVKFYTRDQRFALPDTTLFLPINLKRYGLSEIVNHLLGNETRLVPFDFLLDGEFVRSSLSAFLKFKNLSTETILELEVIESTLPPTQLGTFQHDDWISTVTINDEGLIISGSYDNLIRVWNKSGECIATLEGHTAPIKCVKWVGEGEIGFISTSMDQSIIAWKKENNSNFSILYKALGHTKSVENVSISPSKKNFATASDDSTLQIYSLANLKEDPEHVGTTNSTNNKKQKLNNSYKTPLMTLSSHFGPVAALSYSSLDSNILYSGGTDGSLKTWDLITATNIGSKVCNKHFLSLDHSKHNNLLASGHEDGLIRLWDMRANDANSVRQYLSGHSNQVSKVLFSHVQSHHLATVSYDSTVKLWDLRSSTPLFTLNSTDQPLPKYDARNITNNHQVFENKLFALDWKDDLLVTGGQQKLLKIFKVPQNENQVNGQN